MTRIRLNGSSAYDGITGTTVTGADKYTPGSPADWALRAQVFRMSP